MKYYMAPMEGLTGYIYRNAYHACFHPMDKYFTPFLSPKANGVLSSRERNDILPDHNRGLFVVPQILTNRSMEFLNMAATIKEYGYGEVNLNLGCPSGTVVSKGKGAGFLIHKEELNRFLEEVCRGTDKLGIRLSVKTRLGKYSSEEFPELMEIFNQYPFEELIIHPRVQTDFYKNSPDMEAFSYGFETSKAPVCYNGDIYTAGSFNQLCGNYPELGMVMFGRGVISNPGLVGMIVDGKGADKETLKKFHGRMYEGYRDIMSGDRNVLFKMKEIWASMIQIFSDNGKYLKRIKKAQRLQEYEEAVEAVFGDLQVTP